MTSASMPCLPAACGVDRTLSPIFFDTLLLHKIAAAQANHAIGIVSAETMQRITHAATRLRQRIGGDDEALPTIWQSGCGLESNRWANERIATLSRTADLPVIEPATVNGNQSTNDTMPSVIHLSLLRACYQQLEPACQVLQRQLRAKAAVHPEARVMGRTFLRDARPMRWCDVWGSWASLLEEHEAWLDQSLLHLTHLPQGGYSLGNGAGMDPRFPRAYIECLNQLLPLGCSMHPQPTNAMSGIRALAAFAGALAGLCAGLEKIAADCLLLCSGPDHGFGDLAFAETHNDSTTLAGKSNPTPATTLQMACTYSRALCLMVIDLAARGQLQLYTQFPITAYVLLDSVETLAGRIRSFATEFIIGLAPMPTKEYQA
ncbi:lyase family protein [Burkholderia gladioli]|uniref:lyase family protein n=1 Tax=Burkholderia gladioli TaxID=28095 RepID=UPI001640C76E|nr:lyase family protein [Burkholderia gladioli]